MVPLRDIVNVTARDGDYASETEVIAAALALLRDEVDGLAAIKAAIEEGEASVSLSRLTLTSSSKICTGALRSSKPVQSLSVVSSTSA